jgi:peroxiredoxin Q/BCP
MLPLVITGRQLAHIPQRVKLSPLTRAAGHYSCGLPRLRWPAGGSIFRRMSVRVLFLALLTAATACNKSEPEPAAAPAASSEATGPLAAGSPAPALDVKAHNGEAVKLAELRGKPVVVYFYPKDNTKGCTIEAQEIRDLWQEIGKTGAVVIGVSTDNEASHQQFAAEHALPFLLLSDGDGAIARRFGVPVVNGRARRMTFVIGKDGKIQKTFADVSPQGHGAEIVAALQGA